MDNGCFIAIDLALARVCITALGPDLCDAAQIVDSLLYIQHFTISSSLRCGQLSASTPGRSGPISCVLLISLHLYVAN